MAACKSLALADDVFVERPEVARPDGDQWSLVNAAPSGRERRFGIAAGGSGVGDCILSAADGAGADAGARISDGDGTGDSAF
jgi:hypothetical protein